MSERCAKRGNKFQAKGEISQEIAQEFSGISLKRER